MLFVGMLSGTYSSIFIATPVLADLKEREPEYKDLAVKVKRRLAGGRRAARRGQHRRVVGGGRRRGPASPVRAGQLRRLAGPDSDNGNTDDGADDRRRDRPPRPGPLRRRRHRRHPARQQRHRHRHRRQPTATANGRQRPAPSRRQEEEAVAHPCRTSPTSITAHVRDVPDYPQPGVLFKDITPLLGDADAFGDVVEALAAAFGPVDKVVGIEARGFILAAPVAFEIRAGFVPVRKQGKLPSATFAQKYDLEYGSATLEVHQDAFQPGERVLIVDDVLATGGTARATATLVRQAGRRGGRHRRADGAVLPQRPPERR